MQCGIFVCGLGDMVTIIMNNVVGSKMEWPCCLNIGVWQEYRVNAFIFRFQRRINTKTVGYINKPIYWTGESSVSVYWRLENCHSWLCILKFELSITLSYNTFAEWFSALIPVKSNFLLSNVCLSHQKPRHCPNCQRGSYTEFNQNSYTVHLVSLCN